MILFPKLVSTINQLSIDSVSDERKKALDQLANYVIHQDKKNEVCSLIFVCTHNSRRSHLSQIWAQTLASYYKVNVQSYSAGTEATALYPSVINALQISGFESQTIGQSSNNSNPIYAIRYGINHLPIIGFSKTVANAFNPSTNFAAIMTCSNADVGCPFVPGTDVRISLPYNDPKEFDGTTVELEKYLERSLEIASEMKYVFSQLNQND